MPAPSQPAIENPPLVTMADRCVQCGLCLPHCPTYRLDRHEAESPRGRIAYIKAVASGQMVPTPAGDLHLDHCLGCRRCEAACPAQVPYGELLTKTRARQFERNPPPLMQRLAQQLLTRPARLQSLLSLYRFAYAWLPRQWRHLPRPPAIQPNAPPPVSDAAKLQLFTGCIARSYETPAANALKRLLAALGQSVVTPHGQTCCGTAALHAGDRATAEGLAITNRSTFDHRPVLCLASGCRDQLRHGLHDHADVLDPLDWLDRHRAQLPFKPSTRRVALHVPCSDRNAAATRRLLGAIPGLTILELPDDGCCGAAGLHMLAEPERAAALRAPLLVRLTSLNADELVSANIGCRLHLANALAMPVRHPLELLAEHLP